MRADLKSKITVSGPTHGVARLAVDGDSAKPLVSCLMVTRDRPVQARLAIQCFLEQTYGNRELVIVDDSATDDLSAVVAIHPQIRILRPDGSQPNLGRARNRAVAEARGEFVCQWDDDDLYDPRRLETQLAALQRTGAAACLLSRWIIWWPRASRLAISRRRRWEGSLLSARGALTAYPEYSRGEDTPVIDALIRSTRVVHLDEPQLYIYVVHGQNTFEPGHFAAYWEHADVQYSGERYRAVLGQIAQRAPVAAYARGLALPVESAPTQAVSPEATAAEDVAAAERLLRADRHEEAAAAFEALRRTYPDQPWGACGIARVKARMKDWVTAVDLFLDVRTQFPNYLFGLLCLGQGLNTLGRFAEAEAAFDAARQIRPDLVEPESVWASPPRWLTTGRWLAADGPRYSTAGLRTGEPSWD